MMARPWLLSLVWSLVLGCTAEPAFQVERGHHAKGDAALPKQDAGSEPDAGLPGEAMRIDVPSSDPVFVNLKRRRGVSVARASLDWDLRFEGFRVFTNSGPSGPGDGAAFGPSDELDLLFDTVPAVPLRPDRAVGPLSAWYLYQGGVIYSRYHLYGVRKGDRLWKLQILSYYGQQSGQDTSGLYQLRYAQVSEAGSEATVAVMDLDATGGGDTATNESSVAGCLDFASGDVFPLSRGELDASPDWDVCFLRNDAFANGGLSGPGSVTIADLDPEAVLSVDDLGALTEQAELERFDAVDLATLTDPDLHYYPDEQVASFFDDAWVDTPGADAQPTPGTFIVRTADGQRYYVLLCTSIDGATDQAPGTLTFRIKEVFP
jgi:hypothetical protein